jgi:hypothetical protein
MTARSALASLLVETAHRAVPVRSGRIARPVSRLCLRREPRGRGPTRRSTVDRPSSGWLGEVVSTTSVRGTVLSRAEPVRTFDAIHLETIEKLAGVLPDLVVLSTDERGRRERGSARIRSAPSDFVRAACCTPTRVLPLATNLPRFRSDRIDQRAARALTPMCSEEAGARRCRGGYARSAPRVSSFARHARERCIRYVRLRD